MYTKKKVLKILDELQRYNALEIAIWTPYSMYPRIWLKPWCGMRSIISIGTAESVLDWIKDGRIRYNRRSRYAYCGKQKRLSAANPNVIYTTFNE